MKFQYVITTQNLEEYGENFHKFKGGSTYVVGATKDDQIVSEASVAAEVMKHVNR